MNKLLISYNYKQLKHNYYIKKVSKKIGNEYRQYLGEKISRDICRQLNVEYTGKLSK